MTAVALTLPAALDIQQAEPLRAALLAARGGPVSLDASDVERLGGLCLQVLLSARQTWARDGQPLTIESPSAAFAEQWRLFGAPAPADDAHGDDA